MTCATCRRFNLARISLACCGCWQTEAGCDCTPNPVGARRHLALVVKSHRVRDWFARRLWVYCWTCDERKGPYKYRTQANLAMSQANLEECSRVSQV